jgi:septum formation protein
MKKYILASKSPRRIMLLKDYGIEATSMPADIIENPPVKDDYVSTVMYLALKKAMAIYMGGETEGYDIIIGSDTVVYTDKILGKPATRQEAYDMIKSISGKCHIVSTGIAVIDISRDIKYVSHEDTKVYIKNMSESEILEYIDTDEPYDKAGGYAIQGLFGNYVESFKGSYTNVMGLPKDKLMKMLDSIR